MKVIYLLLQIAFLLINFSKITAQTKYTDINANKRINQKTGLVSAVYNIELNTNGFSVESKAKNYLILNCEMFGFNRNITDLNLISKKSELGITHVLFKQFYKNIEVVNSNILVNINKDKEICMVLSDYFPIDNLNALPTFDQMSAENKVKQLLLQDKLLIKDLTFDTKLKIYVDTDVKPHLIWNITAFDGILPLGVFFIDAHEGTLIMKNNAGLGYVTGNGRVFDPDPGTYLRDSTLDHTSDISGHTYKTVDLENLNNPPPNYPYRLTGKYAISFDVLGPFGTVSSPNPNFFFSRDEYGFKEINVYYFINKMCTYVSGLGFDPSWYGTAEDGIRYDANVYSLVGVGRQAMYFPGIQVNILYLVFSGSKNTL